MIRPRSNEKRIKSSNKNFSFHDWFYSLFKSNITLENFEKYFICPNINEHIIFKERISKFPIKCVNTENLDIEKCGLANFLHTKVF